MFGNYMTPPTSGPAKAAAAPVAAQTPMKTAAP
jgi:hypothetical protein